MNRILQFIKLYTTQAGRNAAKNLIWLITFTILAQMCSLGILYCLTQGLSQAQFGLVSFVLIIQSYLMIAGTVGLPAIIIREGKQHPEKRNQIITVHILLSGSFSLILFLLTFSVSVFTAMGTAEWILLNCIAFGNIAVCMNLRPFYDVLHKQALVGLINLCGEVIALTIIFWVWYTGEINLPFIGIVYAGKYFLVTLLQYGVYHWTQQLICIEFSWREIFAILHSSWKLMFNTLVVTVPVSFGVVLVRYWHGPKETAILGLATQITTVYLMFATLGFRIVRPHIAGEYGCHPGFIKKLFIFTVCYLGSLLLTLYVFSIMVINGFLEESYQQTIIPLGLLLIAAFTMSISRVMSMYLVDARREGRLLIINILVALVFLTTGIWIVAKFSYFGAASLTLGVSTLHCVIIFSAVRNHLRVHTNETNPVQQVC